MKGEEMRQRFDALQFYLRVMIWLTAFMGILMVCVVILVVYSPESVGIGAKTTDDFLFKSGNYPFNRLLEFRHSHFGLVPPYGEQCSFVYQVGKIGADHAGGHAGYYIDVQTVCCRDLF